MAKTERRSGLGRGLGSLLPGSYEDIDVPIEPQPSRQRITFENEEDAALKAPVSTRPAEYINQSEQTILSEPIERSSRSSYDLEGVDEVDLSLIFPNPDQPRTQFKKEEIEELASSIAKDGLLQPILVRRMTDGTFQIIAGERRWQASKVAGLQTVPIRVKDVDDDQALELALIENIQRSDLNPIEEAYGYRRLMERKSLTQAEVAQAVSKGRSTVANALRLLDLPEEAQKLLFEEKITAGHARAILSVPEDKGRLSLTQKIIDDKLTVRDAERIARLLSGKKNETVSTPRTTQPTLYKSVAKTLKDILKTNVKIKTTQGKNKVEIEFKDEDDLKRIFTDLVGDK